MDQDTKRHIKRELYRHLARIGKALGNDRRLEIIDLLAQSEHTVEGLAQKTEMSVASVSQHLQVLRSARLVKVRREGTYGFYSLADKQVLKAWNEISALAQSHLLEIDHLIRTLFEERSSLKGISASELLERMKSDTIVLLDARPTDEYRAGHIPGAVSLPVDQLEAYLDTLPHDQEIVAYCRTSYCLLSDELAVILKSKGFDVRVLETGMSDWQALGYPVEVSERKPSDDQAETADDS